MAGLAALGFFGLAAARYASFHSVAYDLGFFDQIAWNLSRGHGFTSSFIPYGFLGQHFEPALAVFALPYRLAPSPLWLLLGQSIALGFAVVPLRSLAARLLGERYAWIVVLTYLLQLGVIRAVQFDFHTEALAVPFVFWAILAALEGRRTTLLLAGSVPMLCKEDGALVSLGIGLLAFLLTRRRVGLTLAAIAPAIGLLLVLVVMPALRSGSQGDLIARYAYLGSSPGQVAQHLFTRPGLWVSHLLRPPALPALAISLLGVGALPLLRPAAALVAGLALLPALLSSDPYQAGLALHYGLPATPLLVVAAILGWGRLQSHSPVNGARVGGVLLLAGSISALAAVAPLPGRVAVEVRDLDRRAAVEDLLRRLPAEASVSAFTSLVPHLSERSAVNEFPCGVGFEYVVEDRRLPPSEQSLQGGLRAAAASLPAFGYHPIAAGGDVVLWQRDPAATSSSTFGPCYVRTR